MADSASHLRLVQRNEEFFNAVVDVYPDWAIVAAAYAALHRIDAYLAGVARAIGDQQPHPSGGHHPRSHRERNRLMATDSGLSAIAGQYRELRERCDEARYDLQPFSADFGRDLFDREYVTIRNHLERSG